VCKAKQTLDRRQRPSPCLRFALQCVGKALELCKGDDG